MRKIKTKMLNKILKFFGQALILSAVMVGSIKLLALTGTAIGPGLAFAAETNPLSLPAGSRYGNIPTPNTDSTGQEIVVELVGTLLKYAKILISIIAIGIIIFMGVRLVVGSGNEETVKKTTTGLLYALVAFAIVSMSQDLGRIVGFFKENQAFTETVQSNGGVIGSAGGIVERIGLFDKQVEIVMTFIKYLIGSLAVAMIVINGVKLVTGGGEEENIKKARNGIFAAMGGLVIMMIANTFVTKVFYKVDKTTYSAISEGITPQTDLSEGISQIVGITNFVISFVGPGLVLLIIIAGILYLTAGGEEEKMNKAKRMLISGVIGLVVIYGAFALVSTIVSGSLQTPDQLIE